MKDNFILEEVQKEIDNAEIGFSIGARLLFESQKENWELLKNGASSLETVKEKIFQFDGFNIKVQFNPGRMISTSAKVDEKSIAERKCFLCVENLPPQQKSIKFNESFYILCNPFPIFHEHFTITNKEHIPQRILPYLNDMLILSKNLEDYTIFYNGPKCGASAPDHKHFQAGTKYFMPIDSEVDLLINKYGKKLTVNELIQVYGVDDFLRRFIVIKSNDEKSILEYFSHFYTLYNKINYDEIEPMMNITVSYDNNTYIIIIFLREKHRPSHYFAEEENNILLSPASVDIGGVCITPQEKDFNKITKNILIEIFSEVSLNKEKFNELIKQLIEY